MMGLVVALLAFEVGTLGASGVGRDWLLQAHCAWAAWSEPTSTVAPTHERCPCGEVCDEDVRDEDVEDRDTRDLDACDGCDRPIPDDPDDDEP